MAQSTLTQFQILPRPNPAGLFFCLASDTVQGLYFCLATYKPQASVYSGFSAINAIYTATTPKAFTELYSGVSIDSTYSSAHNTAAAQATIHRLRHAGGHTVKRSTSADTRYHRHAGRCTAQHSRPIIIRYIRVQRCAPVVDPCQTVQHIADHASGGGLLLSCADCRQVLTHCQQYRPCAPTEGSTSPPVQGQPGGLQSGTGQQSGRTLHPAGQSSSGGAAGGGGLSPLPFSGFRPIANRGQQ